MLELLGCINKSCEHRWYCKNYEFTTDDNLINNIDLSGYCETHDYCFLDADETLKSLYQSGRRLSKLLNITQEKIDETINEIREEKY